MRPLLPSGRCVNAVSRWTLGSSGLIHPAMTPRLPAFAALVLALHGAAAFAGDGVQAEKAEAAPSVAPSKIMMPPPPIRTVPVRRAPVPANDRRGWITPDDYPAISLRSHEEGVSGVTLIVDEKGAVTNCLITRSSGSQTLDGVTCDLLRQRARFTPARNAKGEAVVGAYTSAVRWQIPDFRIPPVSGVVSGSFIVGKDGLVSNCRLLRLETNPGKDLSREAESSLRELAERQFCTSQVYNAPYVDDAGQPVRMRVIVTHTVETETLGD